MSLLLRAVIVSLATNLFGLSVAVAQPAALLAGPASVDPASEADASPTDNYSIDDFARVRKYDAHVHANTSDTAFLEQARVDGFQLLSINVDYPAFPSLAVQHEAALALAKKDPAIFHWATTFSMKDFGAPGWAGRVDAGRP